MAFFSITEFWDKTYSRGLAVLALLVTLGLAPGCSSLFYYPTRIEHLNPARIGLTPERVWFASADGTRLNGWYFHNKTGKPPKAVVVFFHGNAQNLSTHFGSLVWLLQNPYDFFIFDYRGYGLSGGSPSPKGTVEDGNAAIRWTQAHSIESGMPKLPLVVFGQSLGGAIALRSVIEIRKEIPIQLVVADSTFDSYKAVARKVLSRSWITWPFQPLACVLLSDKYSAKDRIAEISPIPLVVIHGKMDTVVDYELGEEIFKSAKEPKEFWSVPDGQHTDAFWKPDPHWRELFLQKLDSLNGNLP